MAAGRSWQQSIDAEGEVGRFDVLEREGATKFVLAGSVDSNMGHRGSVVARQLDRAKGSESELLAGDVAESGDERSSTGHADGTVVVCLRSSAC